MNAEPMAGGLDPADERARRWRLVARVAILGATVALSIMLGARLLGPSDAWDRTQPKTMAYTTDIVVHGRWALPMEHGTTPASKPPLYNWLAAPVVALAGHHREIAHRAPSILALLGCMACVVYAGRRCAPSAQRSVGSAIGWTAALMLPANYTLFKLGALVRPDMVLTVWITIGWITATVALLSASPGWRRRGAALCFWACVALAALTKGPPALVLLAYGLLAARPLAGTFRATTRLGWSWGVPLALAPTAAWLLAVYRVDAEHLFGRLLHDEIWGRVTGTGPLGRKGGPIVWLTGLAHMPLYFLARSAPWSIAAIAGAAWLLGRDSRGHRRWRSAAIGPDDSGVDSPAIDTRWITAALIMAATVLLVFTLSAGKRADYIAGVYPPAAIVAAAWLLLAAPRLGWRAPWLAPAVAVVLAAILAIGEFGRCRDPGRSFVDGRQEFVMNVVRAVRAQPLPIVFVATGENELQALLGSSAPGDGSTLAAALADGSPFWLVVDRIEHATALAAEVGSSSLVTIMARFEPTPPAPRTGWPETLALYRVEPAAGSRLGSAP